MMNISNCLNCGKEIDTNGSIRAGKKRKYCSNACGAKSYHKKEIADKTETRKCKLIECQKEFTTSDPRKLFCCREHLYRWQRLVR